MLFLSFQRWIEAKRLVQSVYTPACVCRLWHFSMFYNGRQKKTTQWDLQDISPVDFVSALTLILPTVSSSFAVTWPMTDFPTYYTMAILRLRRGASSGRPLTSSFQFLCYAPNNLRIQPLKWSYSSIQLPETEAEHYRLHERRYMTDWF